MRALRTAMLHRLLIALSLYAFAAIQVVLIKADWMENDATAGFFMLIVAVVLTVDAVKLKIQEVRIRKKVQNKLHRRILRRRYLYG